MRMRNTTWDGTFEARLACGYLREDVLEAAQASPWPEAPELPQAIGRLRLRTLGR
jgi:hypothetical protein